MKLSDKEVNNRQASRFNEFLNGTFGGRQCIKSYLKDRTFQQWNDNDEEQCTRFIPYLGHGILCKTNPNSNIEGKDYFHDPSHKGDKGKGKGKEMMPMRGVGDMFELFQLGEIIDATARCPEI